MATSKEQLLSVKQLEALRPENKGQTLRDGGGLVGIVSVARDGVTVTVRFCYQYRFGDKRREKSCGSWIADCNKSKFNGSSLKDIRAERNRLRALVETGVDPIAQAQADEVEQLRQAQAAQEAEETARKVQEAERMAQEAEAAAIAARLTFTDLFARWKRVQLAERKDGGAEIERAFSKDVIPFIGGMYAEEITRKHVSLVLTNIVERGAKRMANRTLSDLRQCFGYGIGAGLLDNDPTSHLKKSSFGGKELERDRTLSEDELRYLLMTALPDCNLTLKAKAAVRVLMATAARVGELLRAERRHINLAERTWLIPDDNAKNGREHLVYLSDFAAIALSEILQVHDHAVWLFPDRSGETHVCVKTLTKQIGDRQTDAPMSGRSSDTRGLVLDGGKWTPHDLRRTAATLMGELGVLPHVIEKCLNHTEESRIVKTYQRQKMLEEQRQAFMLLGDRLELLANESAGNVVTLQGRMA